jgi:hypothetical protein
MKEELFDKLREMAGGSTERLNILEDQIDVKLQMEYFKYSSELKKKIKEEEKNEDFEAIELTEALFIDTLEDEKIKENLVRLASIDDPKAYRLIEKFVAKKHETLKDWGILALQEGKMLLESSLLDENQVFISTGLGGKGTMLRYFIVIIGKNVSEYSEFQQGIIKSEFEFALREGKSEMEGINFHENIATMTVLIPFEIPFQQIFRKAVKECNQYGDFLEDNFLVTNVKTLSFDEIKEFLKTNKMPDIGGDDVEFEIEDETPEE